MKCAEVRERGEERNCTIKKWEKVGVKCSHCKGGWILGSNGSSICRQTSRYFIHRHTVVPYSTLNTLKPKRHKEPKWWRRKDHQKHSYKSAEERKIATRGAARNEAIKNANDMAKDAFRTSEPKTRAMEQRRMFKKRPPERRESGKESYYEVEETGQKMRMRLLWKRTRGTKKWWMRMRQGVSRNADDQRQQRARVPSLCERLSARVRFARCCAGQAMCPAVCA